MEGLIALLRLTPTAHLSSRHSSTSPHSLGRLWHPASRLPPHPERLFFFSQEEVQKQKELAKAEIQKVLKEKDQLTTDLNSMEKSFSDLFKRFEKQKEVIEGYRKVCPRCPGVLTSEVDGLMVQASGATSCCLHLGPWPSLPLPWGRGMTCE